jgi:hypothetical protein
LLTGLLIVGIADKEKPLVFDLQGLLEKGRSSVLCIPARPVHNPEGRSV